MALLNADFLRTIAIGIGATAVMDLWLMLLKAFGLPTLNFSLLGRWIGHMLRGKWAHDSIAKAVPVRGELALGWTTHYVTGIAFASLLIVLTNPTWLGAPSLWPALSFGIATVALPLLIMQPAMGAGLASRRTATPLRNALKSLINHTVFGLGLYAAALATASFNRA